MPFVFKAIKYIALYLIEKYKIGDTLYELKLSFFSSVVIVYDFFD